MQRSLLSLFLLPLALLNAKAQGWEQLANVPVDMTFPVVVALDGNIHAMGGGANGGATNLHLRYVPGLDAWDTLAPVPYLAQQPCGAVVEGKIHFCGGGYPNTGSPLDDHYFYDPAIDQWFPAADLPFPTAINEAVALNGKFYVLTGQPDKQLCQYYDPGTDSWYENSPLPDLNFWYGAVVANSQTILRFGGGGYINPTNVAHAYDVPNDDWIPKADLDSYLHAPAGTVLGDTLVCLSGGYWNAETDAVWLYSISSDSYQAAEPLPTARSYHSMVTIGDCVYSVGGNGFEPEIGVSLLRHCGLASPNSIAPPAPGASPYATRITPREFELIAKVGTGLSVCLYDASGRMHRRAISDGAGRVHWTDEDLAPGKYTVTIGTDGGSFHEDWVICH